MIGRLVGLRWGERGRKEGGSVFSIKGNVERLTTFSSNTDLLLMTKRWSKSRARTRSRSRRRSRRKNRRKQMKSRRFWNVQKVKRFEKDVEERRNWRHYCLSSCEKKIPCFIYFPSS